MAQLSEKDLALLSALMYCDYVVKQEPGMRYPCFSNIFEV